MRGSAFVGMIALSIGAASAAPAAEPASSPPSTIRVGRDGAGPSHLFWLAKGQDGMSDVVGVVDPLFSVIRYYRVKRGSGEFRDRLERVLGACALPPLDAPGHGIRPWRGLQFDDHIILESSPEPAGSLPIAPVTTVNLLQTRQYRIERAVPDAVAMRKTLDRLDASEALPSDAQSGAWIPNDTENLSCGHMLPQKASPATSAPYRVRGVAGAAIGPATSNRVIIDVAKDGLGGQSSTLLHFRGMFQSATPLEPSEGRRNFVVTYTAPSNDGILRADRSIISVSMTDGSATTRPIVADALRAKMGQRPFTVLPTGEVILMGKDLTGSEFQLISCGLVTDLANTSRKDRQSSICGKESASAASLASEITGPGTALDGSTSRSVIGATASVNVAPAKGPSGVNAFSIFKATETARNTVWSFDAAAIPDGCRKSKGCQPTDNTAAYVPPYSQRLTRGTYSKQGMPYAMQSSLGVGAFFKLSFDEPRAFEHAVRVVRVSHTDPTHPVPGNIKDEFGEDAGIDCSALNTLAWRGSLEGAWDTSTMQRGDGPLSCPTRVPFEKMKPGDAINIVVTNDYPLPVIPNANGGIEGRDQKTNHVVLFAQFVRLDGGNIYLQVLESSSSCDGICWSYYDTSFFGGWGVYRRNHRTDINCVKGEASDIRLHPFPERISEWRSRLNVGDDAIGAASH